MLRSPIGGGESPEMAELLNVASKSSLGLHCTTHSAGSSGACFLPPTSLACTPPSQNPIHPLNLTESITSSFQLPLMP